MSQRQVALLSRSVHGDSEVAAFSSVRIGGLDLDRFTAAEDRPDLLEVAETVRRAGYAIIAGKGYTSFGVATAIARICEAVVRAERSVLPVSTRLSGQFGIDDLYLSLPCILGVGGIHRILVPQLSNDEERALMASAAALRTALLAIDGHAAACRSEAS